TFALTRAERIAFERAAFPLNAESERGFTRTARDHRASIAAEVATIERDCFVDRRERAQMRYLARGEARRRSLENDELPARTKAMSLVERPPGRRRQEAERLHPACGRFIEERAENALRVTAPLVRGRDDHLQNRPLTAVIAEPALGDELTADAHTQHDSGPVN